MLACVEVPSDTALEVSCDEEPGVVEVFAAGFTEDGVDGTEGVTFSPDGRLFVGGAAVGGGGYVAEVSPDGSWTELAAVPGAVGLAWWHDRIVVATGDAGDGMGGVVEVGDDGSVLMLASGIDGSNFPVVTPWDSLLVSSPGGDALYEVSAEGEVSTWVTGLPSPNGLVFSPAGDVLYVANTYDDPSDVTTVAVSGQQAGALGVLATLSAGSTQDGVAMDADGNVYIALNLPGEIVRLTPAGEVTLVAEGVDWAASIAFGVGEDFDACSLYATSLFSDVVYRVSVGTRGYTPGR